MISMTLGMFFTIGLIICVLILLLGFFQDTETFRAIDSKIAKLIRGEEDEC